MPKLKGQHAVVRQVLGGWETNGIVTLQSGGRFNVTSGQDNSGTGVNGDRPDLVGNPYLSTDRPRGELIQRCFNTAAFVQNPAGTFGTTGRNIMEGPRCKMWAYGWAYRGFGGLGNRAKTAVIN